MTGTLWLLRHGETAWSARGQHTGRTDVDLTPAGELAAREIAPALPPSIDLVLCSPLLRARRTAELAGVTPAVLDPDLMEWDYGAWEGKTTPAIRLERDDPAWTVWDAPVPAGATPGEQLTDVAQRTQRVIDRCLPMIDGGGTCLLVAHAHVLRILTATWLGLPASGGRLFELSPASLCALSYSHEQRIISKWNTP